MKSTFLKLILFCGIFLCYSCSTTKKISNSHPDFSTFVGNWVGESLLNGVDGGPDNKLNTWVQKRFVDGTYTILFMTIDVDNNEVVRSVESGRWWIEDGKFHEINTDWVKKTSDVYEYIIISKNEILFNSTSVDYQFIDRRIEEGFRDKLKIK